jgi:iron complex outermembrane receptor protein
VDTVNAALGVDIDAGASWTVRAYGSYVREKQNELVNGELNAAALTLALADPDPLKAFNPFGDGSNTNPTTLDKIRTDFLFWLDSQLKTVDITADGSLGKLAGIPLKLAVGADWRDQTFLTTTISPPAQPSPDNLDRKVFSAFGQLVAPIFTEHDDVPGLWRLELSAAARYENYTAYGTATTPKYSLLWSPSQGIALRGTWSRSTRPPTLVDLSAKHDLSAVLAITDPTSPRGMTQALVWSGGNKDVQPESARSWTAGLDFAPLWAPGISLGLTWFKTVFKDRIQSTLYTPNVLNDPTYAAIVTRNPSEAQINDVCTNSTFGQGGAANCAALRYSAIGAIVDLRVRNLAMLTTDGLDFTGTYEHALRRGELTFALGGTWLRDFSEAQTPTAPLVSLLNTENEPINLRLRGSVAWQYRGWGAQVAANFTNGYRDTASNPTRRVDPWTTVDLQLLYDFPDDASWGLRGLRIALDARNVFNTDPPFLNNQAQFIGYDQENANPYGRQLSLQLRKLW